eukprot:CAMPEP_0204911656 /NCGR_PEP_ID=MMETSP1397-20131031/9954_1 /ASSEMBLY_ACC=CAM_ASM_000891 /TAXON_ID=49980 /ORGANISM="Climacostomum Climacostomum virens, Strain Stock W-24" /LENGTH=306 /DNA_ID=CAMNT_0052082289 /DNA_START=196 /DNA_END=1112 /DNA_ORIENTATION=+
MSTTHFTDWPPAFALRVVEARLTVNVAKVGHMSPFVEVICGTQTFRTRATTCNDLQPRWNEQTVFSFNRPVVLVVYHKSLLIKDTEIGRCCLDPVQMQLTDWIMLTNCNQPVGQLLVSLQWLRFDDAGPSGKVAELQEQYLRKLNELALQQEELEFYKKKYRSKLDGLKREQRSFRGVRTNDTSRGASSSRNYVQTEPCEVESRTHSRCSVEEEFAWISSNRLKVLKDQKKLEASKQELTTERSKLKALRRKLEIQKTMMDTALSTLCDDCRSKQTRRSTLKSVSENRVKSPNLQREAFGDAGNKP